MPLLRFLLAFLMLFCAVPAFAQGQPSNGTIKIYNTSGSVVTSGTFLLAALTCGLPPGTAPAGDPVTNPDVFAVDDPADVALPATQPHRRCTGYLTDNATAKGNSLIIPLSDGSYTLTVLWTYSAGSSPESTGVLFGRTRPVVFPAPTGVSLIRQGQ